MSSRRRRSRIFLSGIIMFCLSLILVAVSLRSSGGLGARASFDGHEEPKTFSSPSMASAALSFSVSSTPSNLTLRRSSPHLRSFATKSSTPLSLSSSTSNPLRFSSPISRHLPLVAFSSGGGGGGGGFTGGNSGGGGSGGGGGHGDAESGGDSKNKMDILLFLAEIGRSLESLPKDLAVAIQEGKIPVDIVRRYLELEKSPLFKWLLQFGGFRDRLLADDLFLAKLAMECGVGVFTKEFKEWINGMEKLPMPCNVWRNGWAPQCLKLNGFEEGMHLEYAGKLVYGNLQTAAEYERRRENFFNELEIVFADVVMAIIADFMLVYLPAPTVALRQALAINAGPIAKFFHGCPDNAFQIAFGGAQYSLIQRAGAIVRNGAKLFAVGTTSSLVGTAITNAVINARKAVDKSAADDVENVPILSTSVAYGVYMAVSSNLRYQIVAGVIEQRILEPMLHNHKLMLSALCFAVRTGNTFLGSLLWVDYARLIGIQKVHDELPNAEPAKA
ncbi:hypothetical protein Cgig2_002248 [Carnegiea gigantea]|uniref:Uncharacterized protein n=1 Tax=Carnegiea gigantea TaxID=171969 RepID=A0A9Q1KV98_9CARY|nr:hypothetical protein Cgig2_002248 [Carnegiea gigantea]